MEKNQNKQVYEGLEKSLIESNATIKEFTFSLDDYSKKADPKAPGEHRSYVYALCEKVGNSLIPFYIGEGKGPRVWAHERSAKEQIKLLEEELSSDGKEEDLELEKRDLSEKINKIKEIKARGGTIEKFIIKWGMTSKEAFMAESALINLLQIGGLKFDASRNKDKLTNIVKGHQSEGEKQISETEARTVEEFCEMYAKEPLYFEDLQKNKVKALLININSGYPECMKKEDRNKAIKDTCCGNWKMDIRKLEKLGIEYVFATVQARVTGIYKIKEVDGKKFHFSYECVKANSEYPHGEDTVTYRKSDYKFMETVVKEANRIGKTPETMKLDDMPKDFREAYIKKVKEENKKAEPSEEFSKSLKRKYMILEYLSEDDPKFTEFTGYMNRRIIHTEKYVEKNKGDSNNIYGSGNPLRYIEG